MAHPRFPTQGKGPTYCLAKFRRKLNENEENWTEWGASSSMILLFRSATEMVYVIAHAITILELQNMHWIQENQIERSRRRSWACFKRTFLTVNVEWSAALETVIQQILYKIHLFFQLGHKASSTTRNEVLTKHGCKAR